jgi:hypothetical protein
MVGVLKVGFDNPTVLGSRAEEIISELEQYEFNRELGVRRDERLGNGIRSVIQSQVVAA